MLQSILVILAFCDFSRVASIPLPRNCLRSRRKAFFQLKRPEESNYVLMTTDSKEKSGSYTPYQYQCCGLTQKGVRCKKKVRGSRDYCHYHQDQANNLLGRINGKLHEKVSEAFHERPLASEPVLAYSHKPSNTNSPKHHNKPGYIYVYTLTSLIENEKKNNELWLKVRNIPNTSSKDKDKWLPFDYRKHPYTLIKVGMTTQTVEKRLQQWENQCQHRLTCLIPNLHNSGFDKSVLSSSMDRFGPLFSSTSESSGSGVSRLILKFKKLQVTSTTTTQPSQYKTLRVRDQGFYAPNSILQAETQIHQILRDKYGSGDVLCTACKKNTKTVEEAEHASKLLRLFKKHKQESFKKGTYNIHVEWFLIPKLDLEYVYRVIDTTCLQYYF